MITVKYKIIENKNIKNFPYVAYIWRIWLPFWMEMGCEGNDTNSFNTIDGAKKLIEQRKKHIRYKSYEKIVYETNNKNN